MIVPLAAKSTKGFTNILLTFAFALNTSWSIRIANLLRFTLVSLVIPVALFTFKSMLMSLIVFGKSGYLTVALSANISSPKVGILSPTISPLANPFRVRLPVVFTFSILLLYSSGIRAKKF